LVQRNDDNQPSANGVHASPYTSSAAIASPTVTSMAPLGDGVSESIRFERAECDADYNMNEMGSFLPRIHSCSNQRDPQPVRSSEEHHVFFPLDNDQYSKTFTT
jgi:hypothetical protein